MSKNKKMIRAGLGVFSLLAAVAGYGVMTSASSSQEGRHFDRTTQGAVKPVVEARDDREMELTNAVKAEKAKAGAKESQVLLNDPFIKDRWGLVKTSAALAWEVSQGSKEIVVAVIDTGIDEKHRDLADNLWINPGETGKDAMGRDKATNGIDDDGNGLVDDIHGWNFVGSNNNLADNHGHGTHIAGIIGAKGGNGYGISGVSPNVSLMVLKYFDPKSSGSNNLKNTVEAIRYAVKMKANIINYSGGGTDYSAEEFAAIKDAEKAGVLFVAAAGNERSNSDETGKHYYPADYELSNIISVTAVNKEETKVLASSNYGVRTVDIAAPGENIYSTLPNGSFGMMTGTSQATAFVTGVAALVMSHNRDFTSSDVRKYVLATGDEYPTLLSKTGTAKVLNSYKALVSLDKGVSLSGVMAANTALVGKKAFASDQSSRETKQEQQEVESTEAIAMFGKDFLRALGQSRDNVDATTTRELKKR